MMTLVCDGQTFSLNRQRVRQQAPKSRFASLAAELSQTNTTPTMYVDRDADVVSLLVSFLRSGVLPTRMTKYDRRRLLAEARYWRVDGIEDVLNRKKAVRNRSVEKKKFVDNDDDDDDDDDDNDDNDDNDDDKDDDNSDESNGAKTQDLASDVDEENEDELSDSEEAVDEELSELAVRLFVYVFVYVCFVV
jgi:hypothetical protein